MLRSKRVTPNLARLLQKYKLHLAAFLQRAARASDLAFPRARCGLYT